MADHSTGMGHWAPAVGAGLPRLVGAVLIGTLFGWLLVGELLRVGVSITCSSASVVTGDCRWVQVDPTEPLAIYLRAALAIGIVLAWPVLISEGLQAVVPGLVRARRRTLLLVLPLSYVLFLVGAAGAVLLVFPELVRVTAPPRIGIPGHFRHYDSVGVLLRVTVWFGLACQLPLLLALLARLRVVNRRRLPAVWPCAAISLAFLAGLIAPSTHPYVLLLIAGPAVVLYGLGVVLARLVG